MSSPGLRIAAGFRGVGWRRGAIAIRVRLERGDKGDTSRMLGTAGVRTREECGEELSFYIAIDEDSKHAERRVFACEERSI